VAEVALESPGAPSFAEVAFPSGNEVPVIAIHCNGVDLIVYSDFPKFNIVQMSLGFCSRFDGRTGRRASYHGQRGPWWQTQSPSRGAQKLKINAPRAGKKRRQSKRAVTQVKDKIMSPFSVLLGSSLTDQRIRDTPLAGAVLAASCSFALSEVGCSRQSKPGWPGLITGKTVVV
jgi:hypothetical protein